MSNFKRSYGGRPKRANQSRSFNQFRPQRRRTPRSFDPYYLIKQTSHEPIQIPVDIENSFADFKVGDNLKKNILSKGYVTPTPIQDKTIPAILKGLDVVGVANTGTGKTAAFLIPLIDKVIKNRKEKVLIITPTRELAAQIEQEFLSLAKGLGLYSALCIGGVSMSGQTKRLKQAPEFVIGTPGRLKDLEERRFLWLNTFTTIVLDEVDRMLDMGFINDVQYLVSRLADQRQSLFFSATIEGKVREVMARFLKNPTIVSVKTGVVTDHVIQEIIKINGKNKIDVLHDLLNQAGFDRVLVFGRTKWSMEKLSKELISRGFRATSIHGNKSQGQRQRALRQFKTGEVKVLLATDVAQRGLDIDNVSHVINFDLPETQEDYIHRIGRTGRADKKGYAITLMP